MLPADPALRGPFEVGNRTFVFVDPSRDCPFAGGSRTLVTEIWGPAYAHDKDYIKRYIWYLRQKIEPDPANPQFILTERGFGYRFVA